MGLFCLFKKSGVGMRGGEREREKEKKEKKARVFLLLCFFQKKKKQKKSSLVDFECRVRRHRVKRVVPGQRVGDLAHGGAAHERGARGDERGDGRSGGGGSI